MGEEGSRLDGDIEEAVLGIPDSGLFIQPARWESRGAAQCVMPVSPAQPPTSHWGTFLWSCSGHVLARGKDYLVCPEAFSFT